MERSGKFLSARKIPKGRCPTAPPDQRLAGDPPPPLHAIGPREQRAIESLAAQIIGQLVRRLEHRTEFADQVEGHQLRQFRKAMTHSHGAQGAGSAAATETPEPRLPGDRLKRVFAPT